MHTRLRIIFSFATIKYESSSNLKMIRQNECVSRTSCSLRWHTNSCLPPPVRSHINSKTLPATTCEKQKKRSPYSYRTYFLHLKCKRYSKLERWRRTCFVYQFHYQKLYICIRCNAAVQQRYLPITPHNRDFKKFRSCTLNLNVVIIFTRHSSCWCARLY